MTGDVPLWVPAYVGLGSNLDNPREQIAAAIAMLAALPETCALVSSSLYRSTPLGGLAQPDYVNAVTGFMTRLAPADLLRRLLAIETQRGRQRTGERWAARRIDLDLLVFGSMQLRQPGLELPHPGIASRNFVLYPLAEIAPELDLPGLGPVARLQAAAGCQGLERLDEFPKSRIG